VLKITVESAEGTTTFRLEGKLTGPWVQELERSWHAATVNCGGKCVKVDLSDVTYVDAEGQRLLSRMHREGVRLQASDILTKSIIERIEEGACAENKRSDIH
jgi:ABC-type transporter Mla MlaB component